MRMQTLFGRLASATHEQMFGGVFLALRIAFGLLFLRSGWHMVTSDFSAVAYLQAADGPFAEWFQSLAGNGFIDGLNAWGQLLIGLALVTGLAVRPAALGGMLMMAMYYLAHFVENTEGGLIDQHIIYALVFALLAAGGAGHVFGLNVVALSNMGRPNRVMKWLLG